MERKIRERVQGFRTRDGAGVSLVRVLGHSTTGVFDPILMLDSFDSVDPSEYTAGFPMHPHRGIETISYVARGRMQHRDSLGFSDTISDGEVQWMTAGSGIVHEERIPASERLLGVQLWLNLPAKDKLCSPAYHAIKNADIPEIDLGVGTLRLLAGNYQEHRGYQGSYLPLDYYELVLKPGQEFRLPLPEKNSVMAFTLLGSLWLAGEQIPEKTAVKLSEGDFLRIRTGEAGARLLVMSSLSLKEPVHWGGPIVMASGEDLQQAFRELENGTFLKEAMSHDES